MHPAGCSWRFSLLTAVVVIPSCAAVAAKAKHDGVRARTATWGCHTLLPKLARDPAVTDVVLLDTCHEVVPEAGACERAQAVLGGRPWSAASMTEACHVLEENSVWLSEQLASQDLLIRQRGPGKGYHITAGSAKEKNGHSVPLDVALSRKGADYASTPTEPLPPYNPVDVPVQYRDVSGAVAEKTLPDWNHEREDSDEMWKESNTYVLMRTSRAEKCGSWPSQMNYGCSQSHNNWWKLADTTTEMSCSSECGARVALVGILCCFMSPQMGCWMKPGAAAVEYGMGGGKGTTCADKTLQSSSALPDAEPGTSVIGDPHLAQSLVHAAASDALKAAKSAAARSDQKSADVKEKTAAAEAFLDGTARKLQEMANLSAKQESEASRAAESQRSVQQEVSRLQAEEAVVQNTLAALARGDMSNKEDSETLEAIEKSVDDQLLSKKAQLHQARETAELRAGELVRVAAREREEVEAQRRAGSAAAAALASTGESLQRALADERAQLQEAVRENSTAQDGSRLLQQMEAELTGAGQVEQLKGSNTAVLREAAELESAAQGLKEWGQEAMARAAVLKGVEDESISQIAHAVAELPDRTAGQLTNTSSSDVASSEAAESRLAEFAQTRVLTSEDVLNTQGAFTQDVARVQIESEAQASAEAATKAAESARQRRVLESSGVFWDKVRAGASHADSEAERNALLRVEALLAGKAFLPQRNSTNRTAAESKEQPQEMTPVAAQQRPNESLRNGRRERSVERRAALKKDTLAPVSEGVMIQGDMEAFGAESDFGHLDARKLDEIQTAIDEKQERERHRALRPRK